MARKFRSTTRRTPARRTRVTGRRPTRSTVRRRAPKRRR